MDKRKPITRQELDTAVRHFLDSGGLIRSLPATKTPNLTVVGTRHGQFENPREHIHGNGSYFA
jgi:hypothetical protein